MGLRRVIVIVLAAVMACQWVSGSVSSAQAVPTGDQLNQLVAPIALYPDTLLAQICAASTDPQQIIDSDNWLKQNSGLQGQALQDAAQKAGFDPAFISLVTFPQVLDTMAAQIDNYAALGAAFKANQQTVMAAIQTLRQQAYASGALDSNEYQKVSVEQQGTTQVVIVQPANPQVVYVPVYQPQQVYVSGPSTGDVIAASLVSFTAGIAIGALINNNQPWGWGGWGWGWGGRGVIVHNSVWIYHPIYRSPHPYYRPRPPVYGRPVYGRPPNNWYQRPGYRPPPPGYRPPTAPGYRPGQPGYRPPPNNGRPPNPPPGNGRPPNPPPGNGRPPGNGNGTRPPGNGNGTRPPGNGGGATRPPGNGTPPPGNGGGTRPPGNGGGSKPPATTRPTPTTRPAPTPTPARPATRPAPGGSYSGHPQQGGSKPAPRPQPQTGSRPSGYGGNNNGAATRQASSRGQASAGGKSGGKPK